MNRSDFNGPVHFYFSVFAWQVPEKAHPPHDPPQEQEHLPAFLSRICFITIARKTKTTIDNTINSINDSTLIKTTAEGCVVDDNKQFVCPTLYDVSPIIGHYSFFIINPNIY